MAKAEVVKQYYFVSHRDINVGSKTGRSIQFDKGMPTHVPREMHTEVMDKGILPCDREGKIVDDINAVEDSVPTNLKIVLAPEDPADRKDAILDAIKALVGRNARGDFTAGGVPHEIAVTQALGWKVDAREIRPIWNEYKPSVVNR